MIIGDLVMWIGLDADHGCLGVITEHYHTKGTPFYTVIWHDGTRGTGLRKDELMAVKDD